MEIERVCAAKLSRSTDVAAEISGELICWISEKTMFSARTQCDMPLAARKGTGSDGQGSTPGCWSSNPYP